MPRRSYTSQPAASESRIIAHWHALEPRTSRLAVEEAPYTYQECPPTRTRIVAATNSPSWHAR